MRHTLTLAPPRAAYASSRDPARHRRTSASKKFSPRMNADAGRTDRATVANQPGAPKFFSAFICVHPRQNSLAFGASAAGLALGRGRLHANWRGQPGTSGRPAALPGDPGWTFSACSACSAVNLAARPRRPKSRRPSPAGAPPRRTQGHPAGRPTNAIAPMRSPCRGLPPIVTNAPKFRPGTAMKLRSPAPVGNIRSP